MTDRQMTFEDVVDAEEMYGDPLYTAWLAQGRPRLSYDEFDQLRKKPCRIIEDTLPL